MTRPKQAGLVARRIGHVTLGLHAHRRYLDAHGRPGGLDQLTDHALVGFDRETTAIRALRQLGLKLRREDFGLRTDSHAAQIAAIRAGFGIGICQTALARQDPNLVHLLPHEFALSLEVWIAMHQDLRASTPARAAFDHLASALSVYVRGNRRPRRGDLNPSS
jgi:DNA-binding transcriptional LysR family regulator